VTLHSHVHYKEIGPHVQWTPVLLSEALLAHDVYVCLECPSGALPPDPNSETIAQKPTWNPERPISGLVLFGGLLAALAGKLLFTQGLLLRQNTG